MARTYVNGRVHVRRTMCATCIFRPADRGRIAVPAERIAQMVRDADAADSCIPCHHHLYEGAPIEPVCRGYYDRRSSMTLRLADVLGVLTFTDDDGNPLP